MPAAAAAPLVEDALAELADLARSAGAQVMGRARQTTPEPDPAMLVGRGKAAEIKASASAADASAVIFANNLTPTQLRNLEEALGVKVIDRTQLILDIFARRARTREGKMQVELAQLNYLLPRLSGQGARLSRLGGGIGSRGPGEQKLEFDRRRVRARIQKLKESLDHVRSQRALHRDRRSQRNFFGVALVGYTNAGKSTLFNALTGSQIFASPRLFATLDPTVRSIPLPSHRKALLSDTVGFIRDLPAQLVSAFRATLEELGSADLLLHVIDASHPDWPARRESVEALLESMGLASTARLRVWNKMDQVFEREARHISTGPFDAPVSALTGDGISNLLHRIDLTLDPRPFVEAEFNLPAADGEVLARLHREGAVTSTQVNGERILVRARVPESLRIQVKKRESPETGNS